MWFLVAAVLAVAGFLIHRALTRYSLEEIIASIGSMPIDHVARMAGFAAASYLCLSCFDAMGVRYAGRTLPYLRVGRTSFTVRTSIGSEATGGRIAAPIARAIMQAVIDQ